MRGAGKRRHRAGVGQTLLDNDVRELLRHVARAITEASAGQYNLWVIHHRLVGVARFALDNERVVFFRKLRL